MSTVNPVQKTTYSLIPSNNTITFGTGTYINTGAQGGSYGDGVYGAPLSVGRSVSWNVTNAGKIFGGGPSAYGDGIDLHSTYGTVANLAGGTIEGGSGGSGVYTYIVGTVTNAGSISGGHGIFGRAFLTVINESGGSISGGILNDGFATVTNDSGASITGGVQVAAVGGDSAPGFGDTSTVTNAGTIGGGVDGRASEPGLGRANVMVTNESGGTITGGTGVYLYAPSGDTATVTNAGTIVGTDTDSVSFGGTGAHTLILETGSNLVGAAVGSGATNALVLEGTGAANNAFENFNTLTVEQNASWALGGASSSFSEATIDSGALLDFAGGATIAGTVSGAGTLEFGGGSTTLDSGAELSVADWTLGGSGTTVTLDENLAYGGAFTGNAGATLDLSGGNLTLTGTDVFSGAATSGSQVLYAEGTTIVLGLTVGGTTTFDDTSEVIERGGSTTVGDAAGDVATLTIAAGATWDILDNSGIKRGSSTASSIGNSGLIEKTGGKGTSTITPKVANDGTILVSSGTLDFKGAVSGGTAATPGTDTIAGVSTLEFGSTVGSSTTIGSQDIGFTGGGTLDLTDPKAFWGKISGFAPSDAVDLLGSWSLSGFSEVSGVGELTLKSGTAKHTFDFVGEFTQSSFNIVSGATTVITHT
jgi:hypothetical protein